MQDVGSFFVGGVPCRDATSVGARHHAVMMITRLTYSVAIIVVLAVECGITGLTARAEFLSISNPSFESPAVAAGEFNVASPPPGWTLFGTLHFSGWRSIGVVNPNTTLLYIDPVPSGSNIGVVFLGPTYSNIPTGLFQSLTTSLQARTTYTLTVAVGNMSNDPNPPHNAFDFSGFPGYRVELLAGDFVVASDNNSLLPGEGRFVTSVVQVVIGSTHTNIGLPLGIRLINLDAAPGIEVNFDDVRLDAVPIPDPEITIVSEEGGALQVAFTETVQESSDLVVWTHVTPTPISPWSFSPTSALHFLRAAE
jgi:hypothetical protein